MNNFEFLESIASGFSPITGEKFLEGDILLRPEVAVRLFQLVRELKNEDELIKTKAKSTFSYTPDINQNILFINNIKSSDFAANIKKAIKLSKNVEVLNTNFIHKKINNFLTEQGILEPVTAFRYSVSEFGLEKGFYNEIEPEKTENERKIVRLSIEAQKYITNNLPLILNNEA